jgi:hypothetical protein
VEVLAHCIWQVLHCNVTHNPPPPPDMTGCDKFFASHLHFVGECMVVLYHNSVGKNNEIRRNCSVWILLQQEDLRMQSVASSENKLMGLTLKSVDYHIGLFVALFGSFILFVYLPSFLSFPSIRRGSCCGKNSYFTLKFQNITNCFFRNLINGLVIKIYGAFIT